MTTGPREDTTLYPLGKKYYISFKKKETPDAANWILHNQGSSYSIGILPNSTTTSAKLIVQPQKMFPYLQRGLGTTSNFLITIGVFTQPHPSHASFATSYFHPDMSFVQYLHFQYMLSDYNFTFCSLDEISYSMIMQYTFNHIISHILLGLPLCLSYKIESCLKEMSKLI